MVLSIKKTSYKLVLCLFLEMCEESGEEHEANRGPIGHFCFIALGASGVLIFPCLTSLLDRWFISISSLVFSSFHPRCLEVIEIREEIGKLSEIGATAEKNTALCQRLAPEITSALIQNYNIKPLEYLWTFPLVVSNVREGITQEYDTTAAFKSLNSI